MMFSLSFWLSTEKKIRPFGSIVIIMILLSGSGMSDMELGVTTVTGSSGLNLVASMKKVSSRKATSHIAVISTLVLFRGTFTLGMVLFFGNYLIRLKRLSFPQRRKQI